MAAQIGSLYLELTADGSGLAHGLNVAGTAVSNFERRARQSAQSVTGGIGGAFASIGTKAAAAALSVAGLTGAFSVASFAAVARQALATARSVAEIGDAAKRAGLSSKSFQELAFVARQNRIEVDSLVDGMKELSLRADEWIVTGSGPAAEAFTRLGFTAADLAERLKDPSALLVEIISRLEKFDKASRIRIADEIFGGTGGERFVALIDRGADGIRKTIDEANRLGVVLDDAVIARADEIDRKFEALSDSVGTRLKGAIVEAAAALDDFLDSFNRVEDQSNANVLRELQKIYAEKFSVERELASAREALAADPGNSILAADVAAAERRVAALAERALQLRDILDRRAGFGDDKSAPTITVRPPPVRTLAAPVDAPVPRPKPNVLGLDTDALRQALDAARREREEMAFAASTTGLAAEAVARLRKERDLLRVATEAGIPVSTSDRREIAAAAAAWAQAEADLKRATAAGEAQKEAMDALRQTADDALKGFLADLRAGKSLGEALQGVLVRLADKLLEMSADKLLSAALGEKGTAGGGVLQRIADALFGKAEAAKMGAATPTPAAGRVGGIGSDVVASVVATPVAQNGTAAMYREAIAAIESRGSGDYGALGPVLTTGRYAGDRAYGRYGMMGGNIPDWSQAALGRRMTPEEFLADPAAQNAIFDHRFGSYVSRYGNPQDAASVWFTGRLAAQGANAMDALGTTGSGYVAKFNAELGKLGDVASKTATNMTTLDTGVSGLAKSLTSVPSVTASGAKGTAGALDLGALAKGDGGITGLLTQLMSSIGKALKGILSGLGGVLKGIFSSIFSGFHANGGTIGRGQFGVVGEKGPELLAAGPQALTVIPLSPGQRATQSAMRSPVGSGTRNSIRYSPTTNVTMQSGSAQDRAALVAMLNERDRESRRQLVRDFSAIQNDHFASVG